MSELETVPLNERHFYSFVLISNVKLQQIYFLHL